MTQKNVLITGATRGLGLAIVENLLDQTDYKIIAIGRKETDALIALKSEFGERLVFEAFDLENTDQIGDFINQTVQKYGNLYGIVNNAGIGLDGVLATQHNSDINRVLKVNLEAAILITKYGCRSMLLGGEGRVINISSIIASTGFNGLAAYAASKAGLEGFTRSLSRELGRAKITVNCVAPGYMETDMTVGLTGPKLESVRRRAPLGLPKTQEVAPAVKYLLSDDACSVTGTVLTVDGGSTA